MGRYTQNQRSGDGFKMRSLFQRSCYQSMSHLLLWTQVVRGTITAVTSTYVAEEKASESRLLNRQWPGQRQEEWNRHASDQHKPGQLNWDGHRCVISYRWAKRPTLFEDLFPCSDIYFLRQPRQCRLSLFVLVFSFDFKE